MNHILFLFKVYINITLVIGLEIISNYYYNTLWMSLISSFAVPLAYAVMCKPYRTSYAALWKLIKRTFSWKKTLDIA